MLLSSVPVGFPPLTYVGCLFIVGYAIQFICYFLFILLFTFILLAAPFGGCPLGLSLALTIETAASEPASQPARQTNRQTNKQTNKQTGKQTFYKRGHSRCTTVRMSYELCAMRTRWLCVCVAATKTSASSWVFLASFLNSDFLGSVCLLI